MKNYFYFLFFSLFLYSNITLGNNFLISKAIEKKIHQHPTWKKLIHIEQIADKNNPLYLFKKESSDPSKNELISTLNSFSSTLSKKTKIIHAQCRFPARWLWLNEQLNLESIIPKQNCPDFEQWQQKTPTTSISLIFASGYFGNPASLYGHLLLKFNNIKNPNYLLDQSINFGAKTGENEPILTYIFKGIFGGYKGYFSQTTFYKNDMLYGKHELRDLWEIPLNIPNNKVNLIKAHAYELLYSKFQYFFFKENCALQIADLIEIGIDKSLYIKQKPWVLPIEIVQNLTASKFSKPIKLIPSKQSELYETFQNLNENEQHILNNFIQTPNANLFKKLKTNQSKQNVITALFHYYDLKKTKKLFTKKDEETKKILLFAQLKLPVNKQTIISIIKPDPSKSQKSTLTSFSLLKQPNKDLSIGLRIKPAYFDSLTINSGRPIFSTLSMFDVEVELNQNNIQFKQIDLLKIESLTPQQTNLLENNNYAWKLNVGLHRYTFNKNNSLRFFINSAIGKSFYISKNQILSSLVDFTLEDDSNFAIINPNLRLINNLKDNIAFDIELGFRQSLVDFRNNRIEVKSSISFNRSKNKDLRFSVYKKQTTEIKLSFNQYW